MNKKANLQLYIYLIIQLILFDIELSITGFNRVFKHYADRYGKMKKTVLSEDNYKEIFIEIERLFYKFDIVCSWYPRKADCIHKTLIGYKLIRKKYAIPVEMVVGVRKFPFEAHAWLQCEGQNFFNDSEETSRYRVILNSNKLSGE